MNTITIDGIKIKTQKVASFYEVCAKLTGRSVLDATLCELESTLNCYPALGDSVTFEAISFAAEKAHVGLNKTTLQTIVDWMKKNEVTRLES